MYQPNQFTSTKTKELHEKIDEIIDSIAKRDVTMDIHNINVDFNFQNNTSTNNNNNNEDDDDKTIMIKNIGSLIDYQLTNLINAINSGSKKNALNMSMNFATSIRKTLKDYIIYMKKEDKTLIKQLKQLHTNVNNVDAHLYRAELTSQESVKRALNEVKQKKLLQSKLELYISQQHRQRKDQMQREQEKDLKDDEDDHQMESSSRNYYNNNKVLSNESSRNYQRRFDDYIDIFQSNLNAMRDKFHNVEQIISLQKTKQKEEIESLLYENNRMKTEIGYYNLKHDDDDDDDDKEPFGRFSLQSSIHTSSSSYDNFNQTRDDHTTTNNDLERLLKRVESKIIHAKEHDLL